MVRVGKIVKYGYDLAGNLASLTYPDTSQVTRSFDATDQLTKIVDRQAGNPRWTFDYERDALGQLSSASDPLEQVSHLYSYDTHNRLTGDERSAGSIT